MDLGSGGHIHFSLKTGYHSTVVRLTLATRRSVAGYYHNAFSVFPVSFDPDGRPAAEFVLAIREVEGVLPQGAPHPGEATPQNRCALFFP